jgi:hypothetical protein
VKNIEQLYDEARSAGPWPDVPTIILCSAETDDFKRAVSEGESESLLQAENAGKKRLYDGIAKSLPRAENRLVDAGHVTLHLRDGQDVGVRLGPGGAPDVGEELVRHAERHEVRDPRALGGVFELGQQHWAYRKVVAPLDACQHDSSGYTGRGDQS